MNKRRCLFLDRDGVINIDIGYPHKPTDFEPVPFITTLIKEAKAKDYHLIVVSNQSGVARGYFGSDDVDLFHDTINCS